VFRCLTCPPGGVCSSDAILAIEGHWGVASETLGGLVEFVVCPTGYCCDGSARFPCDAPSACAGHRTGKGARLRNALFYPRTPRLPPPLNQ
jgi:hypothetical protein